MAIMLQDKANEALKYFEKRDRTDGHPAWFVVDGAPDWVKDMLRTAHAEGCILPDDWRYQFVVEALGALIDNDDPDDIEINADIYTYDLLRWLSSISSRCDYVDAAVADFGHAENGILGDIAIGQMTERQEVLDAVRQSLQETIDEDE